VFEYIHLLEDGIQNNRSQITFSQNLLETLSGKQSDSSSIPHESSPLLPGSEQKDTAIVAKKEKLVRLPFSSAPRAVLLDLELAHERVLRSLYRDRMNKGLVDGYMELLLERGKTFNSSTTIFPILWDSYMNYLVSSKQYKKLRSFFYNVVVKRSEPTQRNCLTFIKGMFKLGDRKECIKWLRFILENGFVPSAPYFKLAKAVEVMKYRIIQSHADMSKATRENGAYRKLRKRALRRKARLVREAKISKWMKMIRSEGMSANRIRLRLLTLKRRTSLDLQKRARRRGGPVVTRLIRRRKAIFSNLEALYPKQSPASASA
jgi:hypothetical protein